MMVMSYNNLTYSRGNSFFTELNIEALRKILGVEKRN